MGRTATRRFRQAWSSAIASSMPSANVISAESAIAAKSSRTAREAWRLARQGERSDLI
jgi:hypothetical protein